MPIVSKCPSQMSGPKLGPPGLYGVGYGVWWGVWGVTGGRGRPPVFGPAESKFQFSELGHKLNLNI